jgi:hypothetical protein
LILAIELLSFSTVAGSAPYVMLAQSRADLITGFCRVLTYFFALLPASGWVTPKFAASIMIPIQFFSLANNIFTQLYPFLELTLAVLNVIIGILLNRRSSEFQIGDVVYSLIDANETNVDLEPSEGCCCSCCASMMCCCSGNKKNDKKVKEAKAKVESDKMKLISSSSSSSSLVKRSELEAKKLASAYNNNGLETASTGIVMADEGVIIGYCTKKQFPADYKQRVLVEFPGGFVMGMLNGKEITRDFIQAKGVSVEKVEVPELAVVSQPEPIVEPIVEPEPVVEPEPEPEPIVEPEPLEIDLEPIVEIDLEPSSEVESELEPEVTNDGSTPMIAKRTGSNPTKRSSSKSKALQALGKKRRSGRNSGTSSRSSNRFEAAAASGENDSQGNDSLIEGPLMPPKKPSKQETRAAMLMQGKSPSAGLVSVRAVARGSSLDQLPTNATTKNRISVTVSNVAAVASSSLTAAANKQPSSSNVTEV